MPGVLARIIMGQMMREKNKKGIQPGIPKDYAASREAMNRATRLQPCPKRIKKRKELIGGVPCVWFESPNTTPGKVILYIHGGGLSWAGHKLVVGKGMCHCYPSIPDRSSREAIQSLQEFLIARLG